MVELQFQNWGDSGTIGSGCQHPGASVPGSSPYDLVPAIPNTVPVNNTK